MPDDAKILEEENKIIREKRLACENCGTANTTLYNINNHYYCKKCKEEVKVENKK